MVRISLVGETITPMSPLFAPSTAFTVRAALSPVFRDANAGEISTPLGHWVIWIVIVPGAVFRNVTVADEPAFKSIDVLSGFILFMMKSALVGIESGDGMPPRAAGALFPDAAALADAAATIARGDRDAARAKIKAIDARFAGLAAASIVELDARLGSGP